MIFCSTQLRCGTTQGYLPYTMKPSVSSESLGISSFKPVSVIRFVKAPSPFHQISIPHFILTIYSAGKEHLYKLEPGSTSLRSGIFLPVLSTIQTAELSQEVVGPFKIEVLRSRQLLRFLALSKTGCGSCRSMK
jgi:hypothetical protein